MNPVFADTAFWIALSNVKDVSHGIAQRFKLSLARTTILTSESDRHFEQEGFRALFLRSQLFLDALQ